MKKKNILFLMALFASFSIASCDNKTKTQEEENTSTNTDTQTEIVKDRGEEESGYPNIKLPDAVINTGGEGSSSQEPDEPIDISNTEPINFDNGSHFESELGEGDVLEVADDKVLTATPNIGYDFVGWFINDEFYSKESTIKVSKTQENIVARFVLKEEFKDLIFDSTTTECVLTGIKDTCSFDLELPEGITKICTDTFKDTNVHFLTIPSTIEEIEDNAFSDSKILRIIFNKVPDAIGDYLDDNSNIYEVIVPNDFEITVSFRDLFNGDIDFRHNNSDFVVLDNFIFYYNQLYGYYFLFKYVGDEKNIVLPDSFEGVDNYYIGDRVFENSDIESIIIPNCVTSIGNNAFEECDNLKSIIIPNSVETIGNSAFNDCDILSEITLGSGLYEIGYKAFNSCDNLNVVINNSNLDIIVGSSDHGQVAENAYAVISGNESNPVHSIDDFKYIEEDGNIKILSYIGNDKNVIIPTFDNKPIILSEYLFENKKNIETVTLNEYVVSIETGAFASSNIKYIDTLNVTEIGENAFNDCRYLVSVSLPNVEYIGEYSFYRCNSLREVSFPKVKVIDYYAFGECNLLYTVALPSSLTKIEDRAFIDCDYLVEVVNKSDLSISNNSSNGYVGYYSSSIITDEKDTILTNENGYVTADISGNKTLYAILNYDSTVINVPSNVKSIRNNVFRKIKAEEIFIPVLESPLCYYFGGTSSSDSYVIPETLKKVMLGEGVESIPYSAFFGVKSLEEIGFTSSVTSIDYQAFYNTNIKKVYYDGIIKDWCNIDFASEDSNPLYSGKSSILFKNNGEYEQLDVIEIPSTIDSIGQYQFYGFNTKEFILHDDITNIGDYAFKNTTAEKITLPNNEISLGYEVFSNNKKLKNIVIPEKWTEIPDYLFDGCSVLLNVNIKGNITTIGQYSFRNCRSLNTINFPKSLKNIYNGAFSGCESIEELDFENTVVEEFASEVFYYCKNLSYITFPSTLTSIDSTTFEGCEKLNYTVYKNGCYFGTPDNPYKWLVKARAKTIVDCTVHSDCEMIFNSAFNKCKNLRKLIIPEGCGDFYGVLEGLSNIQYVEFPYVGASSLGYELFNNANNYVPSSLTKIKINGGTKIPDNAFKGLSYLTSIELSDSITTIGKNAYEGTGIEDFIMSSSSNLSSINEKAFYNCKSLTEVNLSYFSFSSYSLGDGLFESCTSLNDVTLPSNIVYTSKRMFYGCKALTSITLPNTLATIGDYTFAQSGLSSIDFNNVTGINSYAFAGSKLTSVTLGEKIKSMGYSSNIFANCLKLETVSLRYNVQDNMFKGCTSLHTVTLNSAINEIESNAFDGCISLKSISLPTGITIGSNAFARSGLTSVTIPSSAVLNMNAFDGCFDLETVTINSTTPFYSSHGSFFANCSNLKTVNLPSAVTSIPASTFKNCVSLTNSGIDLSNITTIGQSAFENTGFISLNLGTIKIGSSSFMGCKKLVSVSIDSSIADAEKAFQGCSSLTEVTLSENVGNVIPISMFNGCSSLKYEAITIPSCIKGIYRYAFSGTGSENVVVSSNIEDIDDSIFANCKNLVKAEIYGTFTDSSSLYYSFAGSIFDGCVNLKEVVIGGNNTQIGSTIFDGCSSLSKVTLPDNLTEMGIYAFRGCSSLKSFVIPSSVTKIGTGAFDNCYSLVEVYNLSSLDITIGSTTNGGVALHAKVIHNSLDEPSSVVVSGDYTFTVDSEGKAYLIGYSGDDTELTLPNSFVFNGNTIDEYEISSYLFNKNNNITSVTLSNSVTAIGEYAFNNCHSLRTISFGNNLKTIGRYAFNYCDSLTSVILPASLISIDNNAFDSCYKLFEVYNLSGLSITAGSSSNGLVGCYAKVIHTSLSEESVLKLDDNGFMFAYYNSGSEMIGAIVGYFGDEKDLVIPGSFEWEGNTITNLHIIERAFADSRNFTSIKVQEGVYKLGKNCFAYCEFETVELPQSIATCDTQPFQSSTIVKAICNAYLCQYISSKSYTNTALKEVIILPSSRSSISDSNFYGCNSLERIVLPTNITYIGYQSFYNCNNLKEVYYCGSESEFNNIYVYEYYNDPFISAKKYFYSETQPFTSGDYWHYVDGEITLWD